MNKKIISPLMKAAFLLSLTVLLVSSASPVLAFRSAAADESFLQTIAANDDFDSAMTAGGLPFRRTINSFQATEAGDDPEVTACNFKPGSSTVWYKYTPSAKILVHMDTIGSNYDTYMAVWTGTRGNLTHVACNDDASASTFASAINVTLSAGTTYYIEVAQFTGSSADAASSKAAAEAGVEAGTTHVFRIVRLFNKVYKSNATHDGYILESSETSNMGKIKDSTLTILKIGDDSKKRQFRAILSFNTAAIPNNAVVNYALVKIKRSALVGQSNIFTAFRGLKVDIRRGYFGATLGLFASDFQAASSLNSAGTFNSTAVAGWYRAKLQYTAYPMVNRIGYTQFRLRFATDDDNDLIADYLRIYSGNSTDANRPVLVIRYYIP